MPEIEPPVNDCISDSYILISLDAAVLFCIFLQEIKRRTCSCEIGLIADTQTIENARGGSL